MSVAAWRNRLLNCTVRAVFRNGTTDIEQQAATDRVVHAAAVWADATLAFVELGDSWFSGPGLLRYFQRAFAHSADDALEVWVEATVALLEFACSGAAFADLAEIVRQCQCLKQQGSPFLAAPAAGAIAPPVEKKRQQQRSAAKRGGSSSRRRRKRCRRSLSGSRRKRTSERQLRLLRLDSTCAAFCSVLNDGGTRSQAYGRVHSIVCSWKPQNPEAEYKTVSASVRQRFNRANKTFLRLYAAAKRQGLTDEDAAQTAWSDPEWKKKPSLKCFIGCARISKADSTTSPSKTTH
jgi:hypothetical protein